MESRSQAPQARSDQADHSGYSVEIDHLGVVFATDSGPVEALRDVSLAVQPAEFVCLLGPSGCGKTTLLNAVGGFVAPTSGQVRIGGGEGNRQRYVKGVVFQEYALFPWRSAIRNVEFGLEMKGVGRAERKQIAREYLRLVNLERFADTYTHQLSGGMKQRVAIARALAYDPKILLMDEPFGALDSFTREELQRLLVKVWQETGKTVLYVTHNISEALFLGGRVVVFTPNPGRIHSVIEVPLPRPRDQLSDGFVELQRQVTDILMSWE